MSRISALQDQLDEVSSEMDELENTAAERGTDMTADEQTAHEALVSRATSLGAQIKTSTAGRLAILQAQNDLMRVNGGERVIDRAAAKADAAELTAGEYLSEFLQLVHSDGHRDEAKFLDRAARYFDRAQQTTADTAGILPEPIVGQVIKLFDASRPAWNTMTHPPMPMKGKKFTRPRVTQRTTTGEQTEGQALSSQKMILVGDEVTKAVYGSTLELTLQDIEWTEPEALQLVVQDMFDGYAEFVEGKSCDALEAFPIAAHAVSAGSGHSAWTTTNIGTIVDSIIDGIIKVYGKAKRMPDKIWLDLASFGGIVGTTNATTDVSAITIIKEALEAGGFNLDFVVSPQFAANTRLIGCSSLVEGYEKQRGLLRAEKVTTLSTDLAVSGDVAFYGRHEGFVQLGTAPA